MKKPRLHVMFHPSGRGSLAEAFLKAGRNERVVSHFDFYAFGPINPPDPKLRGDWILENLGYGFGEEVGASVAPFMAATLSPDICPVAWISRRDTHTFAGFLEWLWHLGDAPCEVVDVSELRLTYKGQSHLAISPSSITVDEFIQNDLLDSAVPLGDQDRIGFRALWSKLKAENAPLRILGESGLVSARLDFFDSLILSHAEHEWRKMAWVVGHVLCDRMEEYRQFGDLLPAARIRTLAEEGKLEWRGDLYDMRSCEVRLPSQEAI